MFITFSIIGEQSAQIDSDGKQLHPGPRQEAYAYDSRNPTQTLILSSTSLTEVRPCSTCVVAGAAYEGNSRLYPPSASHAFRLVCHRHLQCA